MSNDVPRWTAEDAPVSDDLREIFRSAESDGPCAEQEDALWAKLLPLVDPGGGGEGGQGADDGSGGGGGGEIGSDVPHGLEGQGAEIPGPVVDPTTGAGAAPTAAAGTAVATWVRPLVTAVVAGVAITTSSMWVGQTHPRVEAPRHRVEETSAGPLQPAQGWVLPTPPVSASASPVPEVVHTPVPVRRGPVDAAVPAESEAAFLQRAHAALRGGGAAEALAMTQEHQRLYPRPMLSQEREIIVVQALVQLGRRPEAIARTQSFLERYPTSAHARRLRTVLGLPETGGHDAEEKNPDNIIIQDAEVHSPPK